MPNIALQPEKNSRIPALTAVIDGYPDTEHRLGVRTGGAELEDGARITDHAVALEERLTLTGRVSTLSDATGAKPRRAWEAIRRLRRQLEPFTVFTEWGTYTEMLIHRADASYVGAGMRFILELGEIQRVGITDTELPVQNVTGPAVGRTGETTRGRVAPELPVPAELDLKLNDELHEIAQPSSRLDSLPEYVKGPVEEGIQGLEQSLRSQYSSLDRVPRSEGERLRGEYQGQVAGIFDQLPPGLRTYSAQDEANIGSRVNSIISSFLEN